MAPEEVVIEPSSLTKFRKLRLKDLNLLDMLINKTVEIVIEKEIIKSKAINRSVGQRWQHSPAVVCHVL
jgi:hypothetical protein